MKTWLPSLLPVGTLVLGALLTFLADQWRWKRQTDRDDRLRFIAERRQAYSALHAALQKWQMRHERVQAIVRIVKDGRAAGAHPSWEAAVEDLGAATEKLQATVSEVVFIAPFAVMVAVNDVGRAVDSEDYEQVRIAAEAFRTVARSDLGLASDKGHHEWTVTVENRAPH